MVATRKRPEIALELLQEFDLDDVFFGGDEITEGHFEIGSAQCGGLREELVAGAGGDDDKVGEMRICTDGETRLLARDIQRSDARANSRASRGDGAIEEKRVQDFARVDDDGMAHLEASAVPLARNQFGDTHDFFRLGRIEKKRILFDGLVGESATAGFFPGEALVENGYAETGACEALATERARWSAADDAYVANPSVRHVNLDEQEPGRSKPGREYSTERAATEAGGVLSRRKVTLSHKVGRRGPARKYPPRVVE